VASFEIVIDRSGKLVELALANSSGALVLDQAGENMIREAAPFPPPPVDFGGGEIRIRVELGVSSGRP
jgi:TonB family protein